ncbi:MAG: pilus assembly protein [Chloroflexi bacterium]|nr:MAG: pilus assembly protein [Chloroflexota bacterium]MBL1194607.1 pilus assembly protein [Chloroflexota bacterium]NOH11897.1 pilus assembly protein [Chloroflexota bacterium]
MLGISIGLLVGCGVVLVVIPICVIVLLALLGPAIGDVFSNIILDI